MRFRVVALIALLAAEAWAQEAGPTHPGAPSDSSRPIAADTTAIARAAEVLTTQAEAATPETTVVAPQASVPVFLGGREVFQVRAGRGGLGPKERAAAIRARLTVAVGRRDVSADSVRLLATREGIEVRLADQFLWLISAADVKHIGTAELATQVAELPAIIREGILKERQGRRPLGIAISLLIAAGITLAAWIVLRLLLILDRRWRAWLAEKLPRHLHGIRLRGFEVLSKSQVTGTVGGLLGRLSLVVGLILFYIYITLVLSLFPWTQGWSWQLFNVAIGGLMEVVRSFASAVPGLLMIAVIFVLFRWIVALSDRFFDGIAAGTLWFGGFPPELANPTKHIARILLWITAAIVAYPYVPGAQSKAVQGLSLLIGLMVSIGSTSLIGNMIAGIVLTYARAFRVNDRVLIGDHLGDVTSLGFFATKVRTPRNEEITLPNGLVASSAITNYTRLAEKHGLILHTQVTIGYDVDWRKVHAMLIEAAEKVDGIQAEPKPWVFQRALNDHHVSYEICCVTHLSHTQLRLYSDLHQEIQDAFARQGIEILSPVYASLRDANAPVLPDEPAGPRAEPSGFRVLPHNRP